jgi:hypothetical protein
MNEKQKNVLLGMMGLFVLSILYVPEGLMSGTVAVFWGWTFIWELERDIVLKVLFLEWVAIAVVGSGLIYYLKES